MFRHAPKGAKDGGEDIGDMSDEDSHASKEASGMRSAPPQHPTERDLEPVNAENDNAESDTGSWFQDEASSTRPRPQDRASQMTLPELPPHLKVRRVLGQGGTAVVYEALHTRLNVRVAVKVLAAADPYESEARSRLLR
jgi:hypothetical protein